jgi:hypothetical protein
MRRESRPAKGECFSLDESLMSTSWDSARSFSDTGFTSDVVKSPSGVHDGLPHLPRCGHTSVIRNGSPDGPPGHGLDPVNLRARPCAPGRRPCPRCTQRAEADSFAGANGWVYPGYLLGRVNLKPPVWVCSVSL